MSDPYGGVYKKLVIQDDKLIGACLYGDTVDGSWYFKLLREGRKIGDIRDKLMFGESNIGDVGHEGHTKAAAMADSDEVCGCNGVNQGRDLQGDQGQGPVHARRGAQAHQGERLVRLVHRSGRAVADVHRRRRLLRQAPTKKAMCGCTDVQPPGGARSDPHAEQLCSPGSSSVYQRAMGLAHAERLRSCRPALNYYLISTWPKEAKDDPQSRFINERSHANIQKDGTYSVIPRMWGGETTADELRRIADAVDKYKIPTVKVTGGQRIDLLGVKKEDLVGVWKDIGMPSGHAYAKALRTVKTCVGSEWCRFGTQDSTQMGKDLERALWRMYAPHKVKLAVSGCPRNCAEAGIKDVGVIGVDSGWEIYVAGNGGIKTDVAQFVVKLKTARRSTGVQRRVLAGSTGRKAGTWSARCHYVEPCRPGLREEENSRRCTAAAKRLWERLQFSLDGEPDPWFEHSTRRRWTRASSRRSTPEPGHVATHR